MKQAFGSIQLLNLPVPILTVLCASSVSTKPSNLAQCSDRDNNHV